MIVNSDYPLATLMTSNILLGIKIESFNFEALKRVLVMWQGVRLTYDVMCVFIFLFLFFFSCHITTIVFKTPKLELSIIIVLLATLCDVCRPSLILHHLSSSLTTHHACYFILFVF
ncbi:hypothetical protein CsSME_00045483 [Camellia sinensis var. sinensis]